MKRLVLFLILIFPLTVFAKEEVIFNKCVDGDTIKVTYKDEIKTIRMLAIDTPESVIQQEEEAYGKEASEYTCNLVKNAKKLEIEFDENSDEYDKYGRLLAWVFVDDYLLQDALVRNGYAEVAYLYGKYKYTDTLKDHEELAKAEELNIWSKDKPKEEIDIWFIIIVLLLAILFPSLRKPLKKIFEKSKIKKVFN